MSASRVAHNGNSEIRRKNRQDSLLSVGYRSSRLGGGRKAHAVGRPLSIQCSIEASAMHCSIESVDVSSIRRLGIGIELAQVPRYSTNIEYRTGTNFHRINCVLIFFKCMVELQFKQPFREHQSLSCFFPILKITEFDKNVMSYSECTTRTFSLPSYCNVCAKKQL